ncbi:hypothetical protein [Streptomyces sp. NPDC002346]
MRITRQDENRPPHWDPIDAWLEQYDPPATRPEEGADEGAEALDADWDDDTEGSDSLEALTPEERQILARQTASTINHTLAQLFLRLGPPPAGTNGSFSPVTSGGGGAQQ